MLCDELPLLGKCELAKGAGEGRDLGCDDRLLRCLARQVGLLLGPSGRGIVTAAGKARRTARGQWRRDEAG